LQIREVYKIQERKLQAINQNNSFGSPKIHGDFRTLIFKLIILLETRPSNEYLLPVYQPFNIGDHLLWM